MTIAYPDFKNPSIENFPLDLLRSKFDSRKYNENKGITSSTDTELDVFEPQNVNILNTQSNKQDTFVRHSIIFEEDLLIDQSVPATPIDRFKIRIKFKNVGKGKISTDNELLIDS
jgi:hypothetical protein